MDRKCLLTALAVYLILSFVPGLGLMSIMGKGKGAKS